MMCWHCGSAAKGQMHYKENPNHYADQGTILPTFVTQEQISKHGGGQPCTWINLKICAACPDEKCGAINQKEGDNNVVTCIQCSKFFCYMCNKPITEKDKDAHFDEGNCKEFSNPYYDNL